MAILEHLIVNAPRIVISLNCDSVNTSDPAFETAADTASQILRWVKDTGIPFDIQTVEPRQGALDYLRKNLFQGDIQV